MLKALLTDIDGTITDHTRRISTVAIHEIRKLVDQGVEVVPASGNTACFMDALCRLAGTGGTFIGENGGVYRIGHTGMLHVHGDQSAAIRAFGTLEEYCHRKGIPLELYSRQYRFSDIAFARTIPAREVEAAVKGHPVRVLDTGFAIHLQPLGISKGTAFLELAKDMGLEPGDFMAIGDSVNDVEMLALAGLGVAVANSHPEAKAAAAYVSEKEYGDGFVEAVRKFSGHFLAR